MLEADPLADQSTNRTHSLAEDISTGLEYRVLELVSLGYKKMYDDHHYDWKWKENKFTAVLRSYIKKHCRDFSRLTRRNWHVVREDYLDDEDVIAGSGDPDSVPRIDIVITTWSQDYEEMRFPFECKLLAENRSDLIRFYIKKGLVDRYLSEKNYSEGSNWGGMIGYVIQGDCIKIVEKLNEQIDKNLGLSKSHIEAFNQMKFCKAIYKSSHLRSNIAKPLVITHLLLLFVNEVEIDLNSLTS